MADFSGGDFVIQAPNEGLCDGTLRTQLFRVDRDRAASSQQAPRRVAGRSSARAERQRLGASVGSALGKCSGALWHADDDLEALQSMV